MAFQIFNDDKPKGEHHGLTHKQTTYFNVALGSLCLVTVFALNNVNAAKESAENQNDFLVDQTQKWQMTSNASANAIQYLDYASDFDAKQFSKSSGIWNKRLEKDEHIADSLSDEHHKLWSAAHEPGISAPDRAILEQKVDALEPKVDAALETVEDDKIQSTLSYYAGSATLVRLSLETKRNVFTKIADFSAVPVKGKDGAITFPLHKMPGME